MTRALHSRAAASRRFVGRWRVALAVTVLIFGGCGAQEEATNPRARGPAALTATASHNQPTQRARVAAARRSLGATTPALGHRSKFASCQVRGQLPDPACTPGAVFSSATVSHICAPGYSSSVRDVPESVKRSVYLEYGIESHVPGSYEVDHLVSLELGGNNSVANLWPEVSPGYHEKDAIENRLHDAVCGGAISLSTAQQEIARDWRHTFAGTPTGEAPAASSSAPSRAPSSPTSGIPVDFCSTHQCIPSFAEGHGTIVQCADGQWSHSGGRSGVCSGHGGPR
jgi:hypothetical protein